jgi:hypothetical protein
MDSVYRTYQTASQFNSLKKDPSSALTALKICWNDYLKANYNEVLVSKMFKRIPIEMNGDEYYFIPETIMTSSFHSRSIISSY